MAYDLERFKTAQARDYAQALEEVRGGYKEGHWMWYIFPQARGLGYSSTSRYYGIADPGEAGAYLADPVLGTRLREISEVLLTLPEKNAARIFGHTDALKLCSSMTLFAELSEEGSVFHRVLEAYFGGRRDERTRRWLRR